MYIYSVLLKAEHVRYNNLQITKDKNLVSNPAWGYSETNVCSIAVVPFVLKGITKLASFPIDKSKFKIKEEVLLSVVSFTLS